MKLFVVDRKATQLTARNQDLETRVIQTPDGRTHTLPRVKLIVYPPHPDWYKFKPLPQAPLPLYHPYRVQKPPKPIYVSKALPLVRKVEDPPALPRSARNRRVPNRLRENGSPVSEEAEEGEAGVKKVRKSRAKKAALASVDGVDGMTTRGKRKRDDAPEASAEVTPTPEAENVDGAPTKKRRRRRAAPPPASGDEQPQQSSYGTRSRTKREEKKPETTPTPSLTASDLPEEEEEATPKPKRGGRRKASPLPKRASASPTRAANAVEDQTTEVVDVIAPILTVTPPQATTELPELVVPQEVIAA